MQIRYTGPHDVVEVPDADLIAIRGESVQVPDHVAVRLLDQDTWTKVPDPKTPAKPKGDSNS
jgi:hypothetical protein